MSWKDLSFLCLIVVGLGLFLFGSNTYDALIGWSGVFLSIGGFLAYLALKVYERLSK